MWKYTCVKNDHPQIVLTKLIVHNFLAWHTTALNVSLSGTKGPTQLKINTPINESNHQQILYLTNCGVRNSTTIPRLTPLYLKL